MGFFSAVGQVITNQKTFKQWEKDDANKQKQRETLAQRGINQAELQKAAGKGKVIMDVIDIMDTHSEEVAENTETAIMPIAQTIPALTMFLSTLGVTKFFTAPSAQKYDDAVKKFFYDAAGDGTKYTKNGEELLNIAKTLTEKAKNAPKESPLRKVKVAPADSLYRFGKSIADNETFNSGKLSSLLNKKNLEALAGSNDAEIKGIHKRLSELAQEFYNTKGIKNNGAGKIMGKSLGIIAAISAAVFIAANIVAAKIQVKSSRIARWQSREDLKDPKYFVQYTDEQIKQAQDNLELNNDKNADGKKKKNGNLNGILKRSNNNSFFKSLGATIKDGKNYDAWKQEYNLEDRKVKRNLTPQEIIEAEKEQEVIQRVTKIINNKAEEYSEDMETTAGVLIGGTPFLGLGIGAIINTIVTKTGLGDKFSQNRFNKLLSSIPDEAAKEELKKLYESIGPQAGNKDIKSFMVKLLKNRETAQKIEMYNEKIFEAIEASKGETKGLSQMFNYAKNLFNMALTTKSGRNMVVGFAGTIITGTIGALIGLKLQKSAARAGRYKAKRELEEKPENFIGYTKEEFNSVNNVQAEKKPVMQRLGEYLMFIPRVIKDYFNYENYKKNNANYDRELLGELTKLEVSDKQLQEARELQRKLFTTFESVDDKSQEYSEAIEAVSEMSQPLLPYVGILIASIPFIIKGKQIAKGGVPQVAESITGFFAKHTKFLKGKAASKYADGVAANIKGIVDKQTVTDKNLQSPVTKLFETIMPETKGMNIIQIVKDAAQSAKGQENELKALLYAIAENPAFNKPIDKTNLSANIDEYGQIITKLLNNASQGGINIQIGPKEIEQLKIEMEKSLSNTSTLSDALKEYLANTEIPNVKITDITKNLDTLGALGIKGLEQFKYQLQSNNIAGVANAIVEGKIKTGEWRSIISKMTQNMDTCAAKTMLDKLAASSMPDEQALKIYKNIQTILSNMPKEELAKIINISFEEFSKDPVKFMQALKSGELKNIFITKGVAVAAVAAPATWGAIVLLITYMVESMFASMQKQAGRLGVMKALEELEDVRFYADMEPAKTQEANSKAPIQTSSNLQSVNTLFNSLKQR